MISLTKALSVWKTPKFKEVLKLEIEQLGAEDLPMQRGLSTGNYVSNTPFTVLVHSVEEMENIIRVKIGIFYQSILGGCSCSDDPTPASDINEYCEVHLDIDKTSAITQVTLLVE